MNAQEVVVGFFASARRGRWEEASASIDDAVELTLPGQVGARYSGQGKPGYLRYMRAVKQLFERSQGALELVDLVATPERVVLLYRQHHVMDGRPVQLSRCSDFVVRGRKISAISHYEGDPETVDALFSRYVT